MIHFSFQGQTSFSYLPNFHLIFLLSPISLLCSIWKRWLAVLEHPLLPPLRHRRPLVDHILHHPPPTQQLLNKTFQFSFNSSKLFLEHLLENRYWKSLFITSERLCYLGNYGDGDYQGEGDGGQSNHYPHYRLASSHSGLAESEKQN